MKAIRVHQHGGPEVLRLDDIPVPEVAAGDAVVRVSAAGVNFIDVYHRTGLYPQRLPFVAGQEGAGIVEAVGAGVTVVAPGDRVAWAAGPGSYAEFVRVPADRLVKVPASLELRTAAAVMLQGMTAHYLATSTLPLQRDHTALIYAAAGGVGLLLTQIAKLRGATVIGVTSSEEKADAARAAGADHIINYTQADVATEVQRITNGRGVDVVYDAVGQATWDASLNSLRPRGLMVSYGNASGPVEPFSPLALGQKGSLFLTRPILAHYTAARADLELRSSDVFAWIEEGRLRVRIDREVPLAEAGAAQRALEARQTIGKVLLVP